MADFITAVYNPKSHGRYWQLYRLQEIFLHHRSPDTPVGFVRQAGRDEEKVTLTTLAGLDPEQAKKSALRLALITATNCCV